jgi:predicted DNA-binding transcriptional regulator YafY
MDGYDRNKIARRLAALLKALHGRRFMPTMAELSRELGASERTVYRDLAALEEAGFQLPRRINDDWRAA